MRVLLCPDKFKGSLGALEVCEALARGVRRARAGAEVVMHPMADGGDGSLAILDAHLGLSTHAVDTVDPLGRPLTAAYAHSADAAFVELASASGLVLLKSEERDPLRTSTYGTGVLIADALARGFREVVLLVGGSATNDAGTGIAAALGARFYDAGGQLLAPCGKTLRDVAHLDLSGLRLPPDLELTLLCDVTNPFHGPRGAAHVYAAQKGADERVVAFLDEGLRHFAGVLAAATGVDVRAISGAGAAGGVGGGLAAMLGARLSPGFDTVSALTGLEDRIAGADLVVTGEGRLDGQSASGKVADGVARLCRRYGKPAVGVVGVNALAPAAVAALGLREVRAVIDVARDRDDAMARAAAYLEEIGAALLRPPTRRPSAGPSAPTR